MRSKKTLGHVAVVECHGRAGPRIDFKNERTFLWVQHEIQTVESDETNVLDQLQGDGGHATADFYPKVGEILSPCKEERGFAYSHGSQGVEADDL